MEFKIAIILLIFGYSECSRILILNPSISKSHIIPIQVVVKALVDRGHDVTFVTSYKMDKQLKSCREIKIPINEADKEFISEITKDPKGKGITYIFPRLTKLIYTLGNDTLQMKEMKNLMKNEEFDLVIVSFFMTEFMFGVADHFKCPSILFSPAGTVGLISQIMGNPLEIASAPHAMLPVAKMDFIGRVKNLLMSGVDLMLTNYFKYRAKQVYDFNFPSDRYISYEKALQNVSLSLINSHFSSGLIRANVPNVVEIGGIQVKPTPSKLPEKLQKFLDEANDGAILFSFGSNAKITFLSKDSIDVILKVFSKLKQRIIMKWEADTPIEGQPANVMTSKWLPQDDVLAHPNIKIFISHCGLGSIVESKYRGVPIVAIPLFTDQFGNAEGAVKDGWAVKVDFPTMTEKSLMDAIQEILTNSKYSKAVKKLSELALDRPMNAQDTAVYWIEYVLRHHGAPHLHYPAADMNFFQNNSIDVILFLVLILYVTIKTFVYVIKLICCRKSNKKDLRKKNK